MSDIADGWDLAFKRALAMPPADATYLARGLPKLPKQVFPEKMPSWSSKVILTPWVWKLMEKGALETALEKIDNLKMGLEYMNPINYEGLANEAANRYISNQKR